MEIYIHHTKYHVYGFDVESHNDEETKKKRETSIWLACLIDDKSKLEDPESFMYDMPSVIDRIDYLCHSHHDTKDRHQDNILIYVYNLSFEWSFLAPVLFDLGWKWSSEKFKDMPDHTFNCVANKTQSNVWEIRLKYDKTAGEVIFRDMAMIYHGGLRNVAKSFGLDTQKGEIDYELNRLHDYTVTDEEKEYCFKDVKILIEILQKIIERGDSLFFESLSASSYAATSMISFTKNKNPYKQFRKDYPEIDGPEAEFLRKTVSGGITYATPTYQFKTISDRVCHIDANQMHPSSAYKNKYPYGRGVYGEGRPEVNANKIAACHIRLSYCGVKLHSVIKLIGIEAIDNADLWLWSFEIPILQKCYKNVKIEYIDYYLYNAKRLPWRDFYVHNWNERQKAIQAGDEFGKYHYKLLNNSSYGKLIERPHRFNFETIINDEGLIDSIKTARDVSIEDEAFYNARYTYIPIGSAIPAYSRVCLIEKALDLGWENIVYFDTDSIFFMETRETMECLNLTTNFDKVLGGWKIEEHLEKSQFTAPKRYKGLTTNGETYVKAAGFNFDIDPDFNFNSIDLISSVWNVKRSYRVKGGTIIDYERKEISVQNKYLTIYENNVQ